MQDLAEQLPLVPSFHMSGCETGHLKLKYLLYLFFQPPQHNLLTTGEDGYRNISDYHDLPSLAIDVA